LDTESVVEEKKNKGRGMSIAERKRLKKQQKRTEKGEPSNIAEDTSSSSSSSILKSDNTTTEPTSDEKMKSKGPVPPKVPRGKKGKFKKIKTKYAEQDDEERRLRMELLASAGKPEEEDADHTKKHKKDAKGKNKGQSKDSKQNDKNKGQPKEPTKQNNNKNNDNNNTAQSTDTVKNNEETKSVAVDDDGDDGDDDGVDDSVDGATASQEGGVRKRKTRAEKREEKKKEEEEIKMLLSEENIKVLDPDEAGKLTEVDSLTGKPLANDDVLYCVPVCAPYQVIKTYKFKVKLIPGKTRKGKAAKAAIPIMLAGMDEGTVSDRERDLLKAVEENDVVNQIVGNVRIATGTGTRGKGGKKKAKKPSIQKQRNNTTDL